MGLTRSYERVSPRVRCTVLGRPVGRFEGNLVGTEAFLFLSCTIDIRVERLNEAGAAMQEFNAFRSVRACEWGSKNGTAPSQQMYRLSGFHRRL